MVTRREFLDALAVGAAGLAVGTTAKSYGQILGSNDRLNFAVIGLNGRAYAHLSALKANRSAARISHVCDVDSNILKKFADSAQQEMGEAAGDGQRLSQDSRAEGCGRHHDCHSRPLAYTDGHRRACRRASTSMWKSRAATILPRERCWCRRSRSIRKLVQMGTQQRSSPHTIEIVEKIHEGMIGRPYFAKAWYSNVRKSIGTGKEVPVPPQLDWDLWQGPAPRRPYKDNVHPYNWHWFRIYGTGETLNNGTHEVDVCRWALGVDYPKRVTSSGGRYQFKDDWQFYDTLVTSFEYEDKMISWEGKSCQGMKYYGRDRGSTIMGTTGTVLVDRDGYEIYDLKGNKTSEFKAGSTTSSSDLLGRDSMTDAHFANFIAGIRKGEKLNAPISVGNVAVTMLQLSNIAWEVNRELHLDTKDGRIQGDPEAMKMWGREYEKGWAPHV